MSGLLGLLINVLEEGCIYGILAMGVYITYKILDFPDLSVDGTFPLGACVAAVLITAGVNPFLVCVLVFLCGMLAGTVTGLLHVKLGITDLLSGIIVMTGLWSINLVILGGKSVYPFYNEKTIFDVLTGFPYRRLVVAAVMVVVVKLLLDFYFKTKSGLLLRATGDNSQFVTTALAQNPGSMKMLGLALGNGCAALSGCILAQQAGSANMASGTGMVVQALASVIIGISVFRVLPKMQPTTKVILGAVAYKAFLSIAMKLNLPTEYMKLLMAVLFTVVLVANRYSEQKGGRRHV